MPPVDADYVLTPEAESAPVQGGASTRSTVQDGQLANYIGTSLLTPFRRGPSDFVSGTGLVLLQSEIEEVLGTRPGEYPWDMEFGSQLHLVRHDPNSPVTAEMARIYATDAITKWIPRIRLKRVETERRSVGGDPGRNALLLRLLYDVLAENRQGGAPLLSDVTQEVVLAA